MFIRDVKIGNQYKQPKGFKAAAAGPMVAKTAVGIEIELEGVRDLVYRDTPRGWTVANDGSLRNGGLEFVLSQPLRGQALVEALVALNQWFVDNEVVPDASHRCSVHVHIDCTDLTPRQAGKYSMALSMFEPLLFGYVNEKRVHNPYCVPIGREPGYQTAINYLITHDGRMCDANEKRAIKGHMETCLMSILQYDGRYSSINIMSLVKYGSVEVRMLEGTHSVPRLVEWVNILLAIKLWAKRMDVEDVQELFDNISEFDAHEWLSRNLSNKVANVLKRLPLLDEALLEGVRNAQDILHIHEIGSLDTNEGHDSFIKTLGLKERDEDREYIGYEDAVRAAHRGKKIAVDHVDDGRGHIAIKYYIV